MDERVRGIRAKQIQADEIWAFVSKKEKRLGYRDDPATIGDHYAFVSMDADSKLIISYLIGKRDAA